MEKVVISKENIEKAIQQGAQSISQIYKMLGGSGNVGGSTAKKIREILPDIAERLNANKNKPTVEPGVPQVPSSPATPANTPAQADKPTKGITAGKAKQTKEPKPTRKSKYPRHPANPYRPGSSYGVAFDILATKKDGISRDELTNLLSKETGKPVKNAGYDLSVVLSAKESPTGMRHKSAKDGYYLKKENRHYTLMLS